MNKTEKIVNIFLPILGLTHTRKKQALQLGKPKRSALVTAPVVSIKLPPRRVSPLSFAVQKLAQCLKIGRLYHPLCRNAFVERLQIGYYAYERREEWRTCALAAAYAGAFGPQSIERLDFSYSMAIWRLSNLLDFDLKGHIIVGITGRQSNIPDEMIRLTDDNLWTREGVAEWLSTLR